MGRKYSYQDPPLTVPMIRQADGTYEELSALFPLPVVGGTASVAAGYTPLTPETGKVVGSGQVMLTVPVGANRAVVRVMTGTLHRNVGANVTTNNTKLVVGDAEELIYGELAAYRMTRGDGVDATVDVEYGTAT